MTGPSMHPSEELLMEYAWGAAPEAVALVVATHLALCPKCRMDVAEIEALGGELLRGAEKREVASDLLEETMKRLGEEPPTEVEPLPAVDSDGDAIFPQPLRSYLGAGSADELAWRNLVPGRFREVALPVRFGELPVRLVWAKAGVTLPRHTHAGLELTMPLAGGFDDLGDHFERGDIAFRDPSVEHAVHFAEEADCIALVANSGRLVPKGVVGKLLGFFVEF